MRAAVPKQYLPLHGRTILEHTLDRLCRHPQVAGVVLGVAANDAYWSSLEKSGIDLPNFLGAYTGGAVRADTVLRGLDALGQRAAASDWVMVHDAVRPCVRAPDISRLIDTALANGRGALLAAPITDTVKRADADHVVRDTLPRTHLWRALTPQMFRVAELRQALTSALREQVELTDEAMAMERMGVLPQVVAGNPDNIKITVAADLALAELILTQQETE